MQKHAADDRAAGVAPWHADRDHVRAKLRKQVCGADFLALLNAQKLFGHAVAGDAFGCVPAAVEHLNETGIVAYDPDVGVVGVVNVLDFARDDEFHGRVVADGAELIEVRHVFGDFARLKPNLVFECRLARLLL